MWESMICLPLWYGTFLRVKSLLEPFIGSIVLFCGNFAPSGWALCNGQLLSIASNTALFSILGTYFGGDGVRTFALPDLRGRVPIHAGQGPGLSNYVLGELGGDESATLGVSNMPAHNHVIRTDGTTGGKAFPGPNHVLGASATGTPYSANPPNDNLNPVSVSTMGSGLPFSVQQPYLAMNFIIALVGVYPPRG